MPLGLLFSSTSLFPSTVRGPISPLGHSRPGGLLFDKDSRQENEGYRPSSPFFFYSADSGTHYSVVLAFGSSYFGSCPLSSLLAPPVSRFFVLSFNLLPLILSLLIKFDIFQFYCSWIRGMDTKRGRGSSRDPVDPKKPSTSHAATQSTHNCPICGTTQDRCCLCGRLGMLDRPIEIDNHWIEHHCWVSLDPLSL